MTKFIEITEPANNEKKVFLNIRNIMSVIAMDDGHCLLSIYERQKLQPKESYEEIKAMLLPEGSNRQFNHLEKQFMNAVKRVDRLTKENTRFIKALEELTRADCYTTCGIASEALQIGKLHD